MGHSIRTLGRTVALLGVLSALPVAAKEPTAGSSGASKPPKATPSHPVASEGKAPAPGSVDEALKKAGEAAQQAVQAADKAIRDANKATKADENAADKAAKAEDKADDKAAKAADKADDKAAKAEDKADDKADEPAADPSERDRGFKNGLRQVVDELREGKLKKGEVKGRLTALEKDRTERRQRHREALRDKWGEQLTNKATLQELEHHERRMAHLNRMAIVLETEHTGKDKAKLIERVEKLTELENQRHERKMAQLNEKKDPAPPANSAAPAVQGAGGAP